MINISLADWRLQLECHPPVLAALVFERYAAFVVDGDAPADLSVALTFRDHGSGARLPPQPDDRVAIMCHAEGERWSVIGDEFSGYVDLVQEHAAMTFRTARSLAAIDYVLRTLIAIFAEHRGGLLLHAAGLLINGHAQLFIGAGGSGKSTVTALSPQAVALNDDLVLLREIEGRWIAHGTPFWNAGSSGRQGQTARGAVVGIYKLVQDRSVYIKPLSRAEGAAELLAMCPIVNAEPQTLPGLMARCQLLATAVPVHELHFGNEPGFWRLLSAAPQA